MTDQIKDILSDLKKATNGLCILTDLFQNDLDYFDEEDRRKIAEFNTTFEQKRVHIDNKINSFIRFIEKSFAPAPKDIAKVKALQKLRIDFPEFDEWDNKVKEPLIEHEMRNQKQTQQSIKKRPTLGSTVAIDNPDPNKAFAITSDFEFCRPYSIVITDRKYDIATWRDALCSVANALYEKDPEPLKSYINNDLSRKPLFSISTDKYRSPLEITKGIFAESNLNAKSMLASCWKLLDIYDIDYSEIQIFLRKIAAK